eukprot:329022_1
MEFSDIGCHCHYDLCKQHTFLPLACYKCNHSFCKHHINTSEHQCDKQVNLQSEELELKQCNNTPKHTKSNKKKIITYKCNYNGCKKQELIKIKCNLCRLSFCLTHRFGDNHNCTGPIKKKEKPYKQQ